MIITAVVIKILKISVMMMMIHGVSPLRGFPVEMRGIGHLVPILGGQRLAGLVRLRGGVCPSAGCQVGTVVQLVGPAPTLHGVLGGLWAFAGYGAASDANICPHFPAFPVILLHVMSSLLLFCGCRCCLV